MSVKDWFKQMRVVLTSAEKIYDAMDTDELKKERESSNADNPWVIMKFPGVDKFLHKNPKFTLSEKEEITDFDIDQEVELNIGSL